MSGEWLTPDEQRAWRTYLRMSALLPAHLGRQLQRDSGLSLPEYEVLVQLSEADGHRLRPYQLCKALSWEQSRLSHQLSRMERRGLVAREGCQDDGRGAFVTLREAGATAIESAAPGHVATVREAIFGRLTDDERACFEKACAAILGALAEHDQELLSAAIALVPRRPAQGGAGLSDAGRGGNLGLGAGHSAVSGRVAAVARTTRAVAIRALAIGALAAAPRAAVVALSMYAGVAATVTGWVREVRRVRGKLRVLARELPGLGGRFGPDLVAVAVHVPRAARVAAELVINRQFPGQVPR